MSCIMLERERVAQTIVQYQNWTIHTNRETHLDIKMLWRQLSRYSQDSSDHAILSSTHICMEECSTIVR